VPRAAISRPAYLQAQDGKTLACTLRENSAGTGFDNVTGLVCLLMDIIRAAGGNDRSLHRHPPVERRLRRLCAYLDHGAQHVSYVTTGRAIGRLPGAAAAVAIVDSTEDARRCAPRSRR